MGAIRFAGEGYATSRAALSLSRQGRTYPAPDETAEALADRLLDAARTIDGADHGAGPVADQLDRDAEWLARFGQPRGLFAELSYMIWGADPRPETMRAAAKRLRETED